MEWLEFQKHFEKAYLQGLKQLVVKGQSLILPVTTIGVVLTYPGIINIIEDKVGIPNKGIERIVVEHKSESRVAKAFTHTRVLILATSCYYLEKIKQGSLDLTTPMIHLISKKSKTDIDEANDYIHEYIDTRTSKVDVLARMKNIAVGACPENPLDDFDVGTWQESIVKVIWDAERDSKIMWVMDLRGQSGKTFFADAFSERNESMAWITMPGYYPEVLDNLVNRIGYMCKGIIFDLDDSASPELFQFIRHLADQRLIYDRVFKYLPKRPQIIVLANYECIGLPSERTKKLYIDQEMSLTHRHPSSDEGE